MCTGSLKGTDTATVCPVTGIRFAWKVTKPGCARPVQIITSSWCLLIYPQKKHSYEMCSFLHLLSVWIINLIISHVGMYFSRWTYLQIIDRSTEEVCTAALCILFLISSHVGGLIVRSVFLMSSKRIEMSSLKTHVFRIKCTASQDAVLTEQFTHFKPGL